MTPKQLRQKISTLADHPPITTAFHKDLTDVYETLRHPWYSSQKEHWQGWLKEYDGPGFYGREVWDRSAQFVYNHIVCPPMVLWLGEASGIPSKTVREAVSAAKRARPVMVSQSAAIRQIIPWHDIEARLS